MISPHRWPNDTAKVQNEAHLSKFWGEGEIQTLSFRKAAAKLGSTRGCLLTNFQFMCPLSLTWLPEASPRGGANQLQGFQDIELSRFKQQQGSWKGANEKGLKQGLLSIKLISDQRGQSAIILRSQAARRIGGGACISWKAKCARNSSHLHEELEEMRRTKGEKKKKKREEDTSRAVFVCLFLSFRKILMPNKEWWVPTNKE